MRKIFVTGIGTNIGKTVVSAILVEALKADYWKPVQAGDLDNTDAATVKNLISNKKSVVHPETYILKEPRSPHEAAAIDKIRIDAEKLIVPMSTNSTLIIEGAGGLMVPLNDKFFIIDLIQKLDAEVLVVSQNYLGSINHALLTLEALKSRQINILGLVFCSTANNATEEVILNYSGVKRLPSIDKENSLNKNVVLKYAKGFEGI